MCVLVPQFSVTDETVRSDPNDWPIDEKRLQSSHVLGLDRYAPGCWPQIIMGYMKKNRAAATNHPWFDIEIEDADEIVDVIVAPEGFGVGLGRKPDKAIVMVRRWVIAPSLRGGDVSRVRKRGAPAVGASQPTEICKPPIWRHAVALANLRADSTETNRAVDRS